MTPKALCPISEEEMKQRPVTETEQRGDMFIVDRDQQPYLLVNCRGAVLMEFPLRRASDGEDTEEDYPEMEGEDCYELADQRNDQNMDHSEYQDDLEDRDDCYEGNEDEAQPLDGSMESLEQYV